MGMLATEMTMPDSFSAKINRWRGVFATAAAGAMLTAICVPLQVALFIAAPPPASHPVAAWFDLFNQSPLIGLLSLDLLMMVEQVLAVPIILGLFLLIQPTAASATLLGASAWLMGAVLFLGSNTGFEMLALARGYAAAGPTDQAAYLAAGQGMLASYWDMGTSFVFGYVLSAVGGTLLGAALVRAPGRSAGRPAGCSSSPTWSGSESSCRAWASPSRSSRSSCSGSGTCASVGRSCRWSVDGSADPRW
jgi:hypothetical protein